MTVEAIMTCESKGPSSTYRGAQEVTLRPIADEAGEYQGFFEATPGGECRLAILNAEALAQFDPGARYRVTFEPIG